MLAIPSSAGRLIVGRLCSRSYRATPCRLALLVEKVPALGESITEGSIAKWNKSIGDRVAVDDVIVVVETDKVTVDIKSNNAGILTRQLAIDNVSLILKVSRLGVNATAERLLSPLCCCALRSSLVVIYMRLILTSRPSLVPQHLNQ